MIPSQNLIDKICCRINQGGMSALQTCQTTNALALLTCNPISQVATYSALPFASTYVGRMIYVQSENIYYFSNGSVWLKDFTSTISYIGINDAWSWGLGVTGALGNNSTSNQSSPVSVVGGFTNWCDISAGGDFTVALKTDGTAWAWGCNNTGQLGTCTVTNRSSPVSVVGGFTNWCDISAGCQHSIGVRIDGSAWAWGSNTCGQLGDCTTVAKSSPVSVVGGFTDWCQVSAGCQHSLGVRTNGSAWAWGSGTCGTLGDCTLVAKSSPVSVVGGFTDWCQVSAGHYHNLGLRSDGTIWAWGLGGNGRLGDCAATTKSSPVSVVGGLTWCQVSAGCQHSLAVRTDGTAWAWGSNSYGRLGDGTTVSKSSPVSVVGGFTNWCQVSAGRAHSLGVRTDGTVWSWGYGNQGVLGTGTINSRSSPVSILGGFNDWSQVSAGVTRDLSMALRFWKKGF